MNSTTAKRGVHSESMPRPPKDLPKERDRDYIQRWAALLRDTLKEKKVTSQQLLARLNEYGWDIDQPAVNAWLRGDRMPHPSKMPLLGKALRFRDYRKLYPADE